MHITSLGHSASRSISISSAPEVVVDLVGDPQRLPDWAPRFASAVNPDGPDWVVESGETKLRIRVRVDRQLGVIDLIRPGDPSRGAYMRVLPNAVGSEFVFSLIFPAGTSEELIVQQMTTVEAELRTVRDLCEAQVSRV
jgi:hypothetical protein